MIGGELDLTAIPVLSAELTVLLRSRLQLIVIDAAQVEFADCAVARLIASLGVFLPGARRPALRRASPAFCRVLELTGLTASFEISQ